MKAHFGNGTRVPQRNASCRENLYGENAGGATSVSLAASIVRPNYFLLLLCSSSSCTTLPLTMVMTERISMICSSETFDSSK